jgi:hypothetical protein
MVSLDRMQKDSAELSSFQVKVIDAQLLAISVCETHAGLADFAQLRRELGEAGVVAWASLDEATALRGVYERAAFAEDHEALGRVKSTDLLHRWRDAMRRAAAAFESFSTRHSTGAP